MKNSTLFVSGTLWAFFCLVGKSCPSAIYPFNSDDSNDGAILAKNSNKLDLPRDVSQPIIARYARDVTGENPKVQIHLLLIIIPVVMGIVVIIIIVLVVCYMRRRSERGTCMSKEWLIWCGLMKRSNPSSVREPGNHRSDNASDPTYARREVTYTTGPSRMTSTRGELLTESHHLQTPQPVAETENHTGACPSEWSPNTLPDTPNTGNSSLPPSDVETDCSPRTTATVHHSGTQPKATKFRYSNIIGGQDGSITVEQTGGTQEAMDQSIDNIPENESFDGGKDNGKADRSGSDDDVFKPGIDGVSDASSGDTFQEINGQIVHLHFNSPVETVHVGDRVTKHISFPKDSTDTINNNSCAFKRFALERKTH